ncbi:hypothetical protein KQX54_011798 [Cotesia glomerata]|uniref:Non-specific serine/threonine protein kinase n=1 Tax=Cotesia glomerata TaxID=32391 RepID=A0AAV7I8R8_COTGL|nr:hypothetical protein KQX54_011798 [Cotesia glomerata]
MGCCFSSGQQQEQHRQVIKEGWIQKLGEHNKNWRSRYFILWDDGTLVGFKSKPDQQMTVIMQPHNNFTVRGCQIMLTERPKPFTFVIRGLQWTSEIERTFHVQTEEQRKDWVTAIRSVADRLAEEEQIQQQHSQSEQQMQISFFSEDVNMENTSSSSNGRSNSTNCTDTYLLPSINKLSVKLNGEEPFSNKNFERNKVNLENFEFLKVLGKGSFGKVLLCREKATEHFYAIKILKKKFIIRTNEVAHTLTECRVLRTTNHPFLTSLKYSFQTPDRLCFVMEYANGGELFCHLRESYPFSEDCTRFYGAEIISALGYLHSNGIIYRDIKLENILLDKDGHIKIVDFGLCKEDITYGQTTKTFCGTIEYLAPEVLENKDYGRAVDWWSVGVVMYEMILGDLPFFDNDQAKVCQLIVQEEVKFLETISNEAESLLSETDTQYFDSRFTNASIELTPPDQSLSSPELKFITEEQEKFPQFSYENSNFSATPTDTHMSTIF